MTRNFLHGILFVGPMKMAVYASALTLSSSLQGTALVDLDTHNTITVFIGTFCDIYAMMYKPDHTCN